MLVEKRKIKEDRNIFERELSTLKEGHDSCVVLSTDLIALTGYSTVLIGISHGVIPSNRLLSCDSLVCSFMQMHAKVCCHCIFL